MASFWDEFKELFKTDSQKAEEKQNKIKDTLAKESELVNKLDELDKSWQASQTPDDEVDIDALFPQDSGLRELEYNPATDEQLRELARREADYNKQTSINALDKQYTNKKSGLESQKSEADKSLEDSYAKLESLYKELRQNAENNSLKRGMARSSVIMGQLSNLDSAHMASAGEVEAAYNDVIGNINNNITQLESDRETALDTLDLKYASELSTRISELEKERADTIAQYEKYNNTIREKDRKYQQEREEDVEQYLANREKEKLAAEEEQRAYESKYGYSGEKQKNYVERYNLAYDFYSALSPDIAADALAASPNMKYYLGEYYNKLLNSLKSNAESGSKHIYY